MRDLTKLAAKSLLLIPITAALQAQNTRFVYESGYPVGCYKPEAHQELYLDDAVCLVPDQRPPGDFTPPAKGGSYVDPNFGKRVLIPYDGGYLSTYSTPAALSATGKYVALAEQGFNHLVEVSTGSLARVVVPSQDWGFWWSADSDDTYYRLGWSNGDVIVRGSVATGAEAVVLDPGQGITEIRTGGTGDPSRDHWLPFWSRPEGKVCAAPLDGSNLLYCTSSIPGVDVNNIDFVLISKGIDSVSLKRYLIVEPWGAVLSVNEQAGRLDYEYTAPEHPYATVWGRGDGDGICESQEACLGWCWDHSDTFQTPDGQQWVFATMEEEPGIYMVSLFAWRLNGGSEALRQPYPSGSMRKIYTLAVSGDGGPGAQHFGCAVNAPVCVISTSSAGWRTQDDMSPVPPAAHAGEITMVNFGAGEQVEVHRLAKHRSLLFSEHGQDYYSMPRASISPDGRYVAASSNFGYFPLSFHHSAGDVRREIIVETGLGEYQPPPPPPPPPPAVPAIQEFSASPPKVKPGRTTKLSWQTSNAESVVIEPGIGEVAASGSYTVSPAVTTAYTLTASNQNKQTSKSITVTVRENNSAKNR